jgi:dTDP-4-amino-4,6-dideoxygalactose transaminase
MYILRSTDPDRLVLALADAGVQVRRYYPIPVHRQPAMPAYADGGLPSTDETARSIVALPMGPELRAEQVDTVVAACSAAVPARVS